MSLLFSVVCMVILAYIIGLVTGVLLTIAFRIKKAAANTKAKKENKTCT